ncbi:MAG: type III-B CRISPR module RAMP protein Cmr4 [Egibacteraceae bacterium]
MAPREQGIALLIAETSIHCGVGQDVGPIDLPIQRDKVTRTPVIYGSSLKGGWRDAVHARDPGNATRRFGPRVDASKEPLERGAVGVGEARVLCYPVPSAQGLFAYVTSPGELARLRRACKVAGVTGPRQWPTEVPDDGTAFVSGDKLRFGAGAGPQVIALGEYTLTATESEELRAFGQWVAAMLLPGEELDYWGKALTSQSVLVSDDQFKAFVNPAVVVTRVQLEEGKKTVKKGQLLTEEVLPADVILWAGLNGAIDQLATALPAVVTVGGDETIGRGMLRHAILRGAAA